MKTYSLFLYFAVLTLVPQISLACPDIGKIPDFNCDGNLDITILGDSLAYGFGDLKNGNKGGYAVRIEKKLPQATIHNLGIPGLFSRELVGYLDDTFRKEKKPEWKTALVHSDLVVLDLGRNDRWLFGFPSATYRNLKRAAAMIHKSVAELGEVPPLVVTAVLMLPNRGSQGPWVKELDALILKGSTQKNPADLRFDLVSKRLLSNDQVHPTSEGYNSLAQTLFKYLIKKVPGKMRKLHPDTDTDGIPDLFEETRYGTNKLLADTDGDTFTDKQEIFGMGTDPLIPQ